MLLQALAMTSFCFLATKITVLACTFGQEPDPASDNKYRWVIPVEDPCQCTQLGLGSFNTRAPCRAFPVTYYDDFLVSNDPEEIRQWLNCTNGLSGTINPCPSGIQPLGMEDGTIQDDKITASSYSLYSRCVSHFARLNKQEGAWCAGTQVPNPWIQVEFTAGVFITGVITQGMFWKSDDFEWVAEYQVAYSSDGQSWDNVTNANGTPTTFVGNTDHSSNAETVFGSALHTRYIRILPTACYEECSMRFELFGCY